MDSADVATHDENLHPSLSGPITIQGGNLSANESSGPVRIDNGTFSTTKSSGPIRITNGNFYSTISDVAQGPITINYANFHSSVSNTNGAPIAIHGGTFPSNDYPRNLVLCFDGTTDKFGTNRVTNVVRIYELLRKDDRRQFCYYQPGIGAYDAKVPLQEQSGSLFSKTSLAIEAIFSNDIRKHILAGYKFLMKHYRLGDRVYMFGFSRGAYTARALCGMLEKVGLLSFGDDEQVDFAWDMYEQGHAGLAENFRKVFCQDVEVLFLGLWDTVKSTRQNYSDPQKDSFVSYVYHALALDERRVNFQPHRYQEPKTLPKNHKPPTRVTERWFVGDHTDIGGRFAFQSLNQEALANPPFRWIVWAAACAAGNAGESYLLFDDRAFVKYFRVLLYHGKIPPTDFDPRNPPDDILTAKYFFLHPPSEDSAQAFHTGQTRPHQEALNTQFRVHDSFEPLSIWRATQGFHGKGLHGNKRNLDNAILHPSVKIKLARTRRYGGNNRDKLYELNADEGIWGVFGVDTTQPVTFRV